MLFQIQYLPTVGTGVRIELRLIEVVPTGTAIDFDYVRGLDQALARGPRFKCNSH